MTVLRDVLVGCLLAFFLVHVTVPVHEFGHLAFGVLAGGRFRRFRAGPFEWERWCDAGRPRVDFGLAPWTLRDLGEVEVVPRMPTPRWWYRVRQVGFALSGFAVQVPVVYAAYARLRPHLAAQAADALASFLLLCLLPNVIEEEGDFRMAFHAVLGGEAVREGYDRNLKRWQALRC